MRPFLYTTPLQRSINTREGLDANAIQLAQERTPVDDLIGNLPFIVRRDHRIVAAFARKTAAEEWAQMKSWNDESRFTVHTAAEVLFAFQDGEEV